jgi:CRISPR-associated protein Csx3
MRGPRNGEIADLTGFTAMWSNLRRVNYMNLFPAVILGGPPHSGKTVLGFSLSQTLRARNIAHYLLRAAPDGEGDWSNSADQAGVLRVRFKGRWTSRWIDVTCRDIARRTLPLLVDVGGRPTPDQEIILDQCTHAILLIRDGDAAGRARWQSLAQTRNLQVLADLDSSLDPAAARGAPSPGEPVRGTLAGLERSGRASGPLFDALVDRVGALFGYTETEVLRAHLASAPFRVAPEGAIHLANLAALARSLRPDDPAGRLDLRRDIPRILEAIPAGVPLAIYGRAPNPLVAAIARQRDLRWQFDARLGWVEPLALPVCPPGGDGYRRNGLVAFDVSPIGHHAILLGLRIADGYLDYEDARGLALPFVDPALRVEVDGKLPQWLISSLAIAYRPCAGFVVSHM